MDKRLFLAFALSGAVVVATPLLFPRAKTAPVPAATSQTAQPAAGAEAAPVAEAQRATAVTPALARAAESTPSVVAVAETLTVNTSVSHTRFSTLGAAPIDVQVLGYNSLGAGKGVASIP